MKLQLETNIGFVLVESSGHYIEIYTSEDDYQEGLINLWDYEKNEIRLIPTLSNIIREVLSALGEHFHDFWIGEIDILEGELEELLEPDALERLKLMQNRDDYDA